MSALTNGGPKELVDVGGTPALGRALAECASSGIEEVLIVIAPGKDAIRDYATPLAGAPAMPKRIDFALQQEPRGLADAIRLGRKFADGGPIGVASPDNLFAAAIPAMRQVIDAYSETLMNVVGIVEIPATDAPHRGPTSVYPGQLDGDLFRIERVPDKPRAATRFDTGNSASALTGIGRYVFANEVFDVIDDVERDLANGVELDDIPVMQRLLAANRLVGRRIHGQFLDTGIPDGLADAINLLRDTR